MNNQSAVQELLFENQPIHVFEYGGKIAFFINEIGHVLDIKDVSRTIRRSKTLEKGVDFDIIPTTHLTETDKLSVSDRGLVTILYLSGFFLYVLRSNKDIAIPFIRWAIREAIPQAFQQRQIPEISENMLCKMIIQERQGSLYARQILADHGFVPASDGNKQLSFHGGGHE